MIKECQSIVIGYTVDSVSSESQSVSGDKIPEVDSLDNGAKEVNPEAIPESKRVVAETIHESNRSGRFSKTKTKLSALIAKTSESIFPQASSNDDFLGRVLNTKYGIKRLIKKDDFGITYSGRDITNRNKIIVKTPYYTSEKIIAEFKTMAQKNRSMSHKNIIEYIDYFETSNGRPFLVSRLTIGIYLDDLIKEIGMLKTKEDFQSTLYQICGGIEYAHSNDIVHGALKPSNILFEESEGEITVKLSDFATSEYKRAVLEHVEQDYEFEDLSYLTPEHFREDEVVKSSDIYSLGLLSYLLLTGKDAYEEYNRTQIKEAHLTESKKPTELSEARPDFHCVDDLNRIISETLDSDKDWRIQNVKELKEEIDNWINSEAKSASLPEASIEEKPSTLTKEEQEGLKSTLHNLVALKKHQVEQEETVIMKFTDLAAKSGPRQSPQKAAARLVITYVGGALFLVLLATYSILHWDKIQETYLTQSKNLSAYLNKEEPEQVEDNELPPVEGAASLPPIKKYVAPKGKQVKAKANPYTLVKGKKRSNRKRFKYSESPSYRQFLPKDNASEKEIIDPSQTSRFKKLPE